MSNTKKPIRLVGWAILAISWGRGVTAEEEIKFVSPSADAVVSGLCQIEVQSSSEEPPAFILLSIDRRWVQSTNRWPCRYEWNTTEWPNGECQLQVEVYNAAHQRIHSQELRVQVHNPPRLKSDPLPSSRAADNLGQTAATPPAIARSTPKRSGPADGTRHTENPAIPSPPPTAEWVQPPSPVKNAQGTVPSATAPGVPGQPEPAERVSHSPAPAVSPSPSNEGWSFPPTPGKPAEPSSAWLTNLKRQPRQPCFLMFIYKAAVSIVTQTYLIGEKVFAPVRLIFEGIGAQVQWDAATRILQIHHLGVEIILPPDGHELLVDGQPVPLSAPIFIENGWAMMHVRMLEEILPAKVRWRYDLRRVDVILPQEK